MELQNKQPLERYVQEDEIDLFEVFSSLFKQWRLIICITLVGAVLSIVVALATPKQYAVTAQVALPDIADVRLLSNRGYLAEDAAGVFQKYYQRLISPAHFDGYLIQGDWVNRFYSEKLDVARVTLLRAKLRESLKIEVIHPKQVTKGAASPPKVVGLAMMGKDEPLIVKFLNGYIEFTGDVLLRKIKESGQKVAASEIKKINAEIFVLRKIAKRYREARLVLLNDALLLAAKVGIEKPDSVRLYSQTGELGFVGLTSGSVSQEASLFLMGAGYLEGEIHSLQKRLSDDPYIKELVPLLKRLDQFDQLTYDFMGIKLYVFDKHAVIDGQAEKPNRTLIVVTGVFLSLFVAVFVALILGAIKRRQQEA